MVRKEPASTASASHTYQIQFVDSSAFIVWPPLRRTACVMSTVFHRPPVVGSSSDSFWDQFKEARQG